jgi:hypothetical protein
MREVEGVRGYGMWKKGKEEEEELIPRFPGEVKS